MKQVFKKDTKIQVVRTDSDNWYKVGEIYTVHSYLEHEHAYVVEEDYDKWRDTAWIDAKDVEMYIDWSNAPEGYDFWIVDDVDDEGTMPPTFHKYVENYECYGACYVDENRSYWRADSSRIIIHKRPEEKEQEMNEWKYGLPPVGTEFEYSFGNVYWFKATSTYVVGDSGVVALCGTMESVVEQYLDNEECEFRPIKSKEQEEKEKAIAEMILAAEPDGHLYNTASLFCERLFNAGWRKVE